jgi:hypothetical protein
MGRKVDLLDICFQNAKAGGFLHTVRMQELRARGKITILKILTSLSYLAGGETANQEALKVGDRVNRGLDRIDYIRNGGPVC